MALITNNISGSSAGSWRLGLTGTVAIANPGVNSFPAMPGNDVSFFVSGAIGGKAAGSQTVSVFGGDAVISGSLTVGTGSITITSNEVQFLGGAARIFSGSGGLTFSDSTGTKTLSSLSTGGGGGSGGPFTEASNVAAFTTSSIAIGYGAAATGIGSNVFFYVSGSSDGLKDSVFGGNVVVSGALNAIGNITGSNALVSGDLAVNGGDLTSTAGTFNLLNSITTLNVGTSATSVKIGGTGTTTSIFGNLYVSGTVVSVDSTNLKVSDPIVLLGSGSAGPSAKSAIAFASGSTVSASSLIFGAGVGSDVLAAARQDVQDGNLAQASLSFTNLVPVRASSFQVGGGTAVVTSSDGLVLNVGGTSTTTLSGSTVVLDTNAATNFTRNGARVGQLIGTDGTEFKLAAVTTLGVATNLILTGSGIDLSANTQGINLNFAGTGRGTISYASNTLQVGTLTGVALTLSGTNGFNLVHGTAGATFIKDQGSPGYLVVEGDGNDARLKATADLVLRADGNDIKFNNAAQTVLTLTTAGNNANLQGASNQQVNIGAVGSGGMTVSGSTVIANAGAGGFIFQKNGDAELLVNAVGSTTTVSGSASQNITLASGLGTTTLVMSGSAVELNASVLSGVTFKKDGTAFAVAGQTVDGITGLFPNSDSGASLGSPQRRWANVYTGDLHLRNDRGDYTLIEEEDFLSIRFNKSGKRYKFLLEPVPELDEK